MGWYRHRFRGRCRGRCHCQHPIPAPAHLPWYHLGTTGASTSTDVDKNTTLGVTIMCEKHFALSAKYIEVIFFTIPIGFCPIFPWYWLSKDKIDSLNQLMVPVPKLVPAPWHHWHRHWHFSSVSKLGTGTNKNWYQPTLILYYDFILAFYCDKNSLPALSAHKTRTRTLPVHDICKWIMSDLVYVL